MEMKHIKTQEQLNEAQENLNPSDVSLGQISINIPSGIKSHMDRLGIPQNNHSELFREYIDFLLGVNYGREVDQFTRWTEQEDNIVDFIDYEPIGIGSPEGINGLTRIFSPLESDMVKDWNSDPNIQKWVRKERILLQQETYDQWSIWGIQGDKEVINYIIQHFSW
jgi:hypothetical protein